MVWIALVIVLLWPGWSAAQPQVGGVVSSPNQFRVDCTADEILKSTGSRTWACAADNAGGSGAILDLGDDAVNESTNIGEIATTGDTNSIFTEPSADKLLINLGNNWPSADTATSLAANGANCAAGQAPRGVDASGAAEDCTAYEGLLVNSLGLSLALNDENGTGGAVVFGINPTLTTPVIILRDADGGAPTANGSIMYDRITERLEVGDGTGTSEFVKVGTLTDTLYCTWDAAGQEIDCNTTAAGDITDVFDCASGNCSSITLSDGDLLNMSAVAPNTTTEGLILPQTADCTSATALGQVCVDSDNGTLYIGDSLSAVATGVDTDDQTLDEAFDQGKVIDGANSQANAFVVGDGTDGFRMYVGTGGPTLECFIGAGTCNIVNDIPSGNSYILKYNTTTGITIDSSGNVTLANNLIETKSVWFSAGSLSTDETQCTVPAERTINSGPRVWTVNCADNAGSIMYGSVAMPDAYNGGTVTFELQAVNENATPSGNLNFDFSAMCRGDSDLLNSTWGSSVEANLAMDTQYDLEHVTTAAVTPNGTCAAGDTLFWRAVMDDVSTTTQVANTYIIGVKMEYPTNDWSDN